MTINVKLWALLAFLAGAVAGGAAYVFLTHSVWLFVIIGVLVFVGFGPHHLLHAIHQQPRTVDLHLVGPKR